VYRREVIWQSLIVDMIGNSITGAATEITFLSRGSDFTGGGGHGEVLSVFEFLLILFRIIKIVFWKFKQ